MGVSVTIAAFCATTAVAFVPPSPSLLAPGPDELSTQLAKAEERALESEAIGRALERLHNRWAELAIAGKLRAACEDREARSIAIRSRKLGQAHRDAVQSARAQAKRLERVAAAPTVVPAIDPATAKRRDEVARRIAKEVDRWTEIRAWHHRYIEPAVKTCASKLALAPEAGLAPVLPCTEGECPPAVAIIALKPGRICPSNQLAADNVLIVRDGQACHSTTTCSCTPAPILPGAVLGP